MTLPACLLASPALPLAPCCTVAFSGGADSTALLLCLHQLRGELGLTSLSAVHVHHGIRGDEADRDAQFCADLCAKHGIPFRLVRVDVPAYAREHRLSTETAARILRYEALRQAAPEGDIATAHHAGDNAETLLFHLMRGSGLNGLCGIPPRSGRIVRPLLAAEKDAILAYLRENWQDYVEDSTNLADDSSRNRIRHDILPRMQQENPAVIAHLSRTAAMLAADEAYLSGQAAVLRSERYDPERGSLCLRDDLPPQVLRMRIYMQILAEYGVDASFSLLQRIDALCLAGQGKLCISGRLYAAADGGRLYFFRDESPQTDCLPLVIGENRLFGARVCTASLEEAPDRLSLNYHKSTMKNTLDFDKISGRPYFRRWRPDDRLRRPGDDRPRRLKTRIAEAVPQYERQTLCALYDDRGCLWCEGIGTDVRALPDEQTRRLLVLSAKMQRPVPADDQHMPII